MIAAAAVLVVLAIAALVGWGTYWMVLDARERRWQQRMADRAVAAYRAGHLADDRRPE